MPARTGDGDTAAADAGITTLVVQPAADDVVSNVDLITYITFHTQTLTVYYLSMNSFLVRYASHSRYSTVRCSKESTLNSTEPSMLVFSMSKRPRPSGGAIQRQHSFSSPLQGTTGQLFLGAASRTQRRNRSCHCARSKASRWTLSSSERCWNHHQ